MGFQTKKPLTIVYFLSQPVGFFLALSFITFTASLPLSEQKKNLPEAERFYFSVFPAFSNCSRNLFFLKKRGKNPIMSPRDDSLKLMCLPCLN